MSLETALALFAPSDVDTFEAVSGALEQLAYDLDGYKITTKIEEARLNELLGQVKVAIGDIENARTKQVKPLNDEVKAINDVWRAPRERLEKLEKLAKRSLVLWLQAEDERIAKEQAEARRRQEEAMRKQAESDRLKQEALDKADRAKNSMVRQQALQLAETHAMAESAASEALMQARFSEPLPAPRGIKTDSVTSGLVDRWTFRVTDKTQVPAEFMVVNDHAVRQAIAEGARGIPGLEIYAESTLASRIRR